jgi:hypothetical protein
MNELAIMLTFDERQTLVDLLSDAIEHRTTEHEWSRDTFNLMVQLRARINGTLDADVER